MLTVAFTLPCTPREEGKAGEVMAGEVMAGEGITGCLPGAPTPTLLGRF